MIEEEQTHRNFLRRDRENRCFMTFPNTTEAMKMEAVSYTHLDVYKRQDHDCGYQANVFHEALAGCGAEPGQDPSALLGEDLSKGFLDRASEPCGFPQ